MKVSVVPEKCIACGLCQVLAPTLFDYTDEGIVLFKDQPTHLTKMLDSTSPIAAECMTAYKECPTRAIIVDKTE